MAVDKTRVLIVDDEPMVRRTLAMAMEETGWEIAEADSGEAALVLFESRPFDLLLVDKNMPKMSGLELVRRVRTTHEDVTVVMITAYGSSDSAIELMHLRASAYLEKPFDDIFAVVRTLEQALATQAERRRAMRGAADYFRNATHALLSPSTSTREERPLRVLLVAPSLTEREWLACRLAKSHDEVGGAANARDAEALLAGRQVDLVVVDAGIAESEIFALVELIRTAAPNTVCVVLVDKPSLRSVTRLIQLDVRAVLDKPLDDRQFADRLEGILTRLRWPRS